jgi:hypothetical protein
MSVCFYRCADELEARAAELEAAESWDDIKRLASARTLRDLAGQIRADSRPCIQYPDCGCRSAGTPALNGGSSMVPGRSA